MKMHHTVLKSIKGMVRLLSLNEEINASIKDVLDKTVLKAS